MGKMEDLKKISENPEIKEQIQSTWGRARRNCNVRLIMGLRQVVKALQRDQVAACVLSQGVKEAKYCNLLKALCEEKNVPLVLYGERVELGELVGCVKKNKSLEVKKNLPCGSAA